MSLLFGAEFDAEMERGRQLQAGIEAEETLQLPPRDTKQSDKLQAREEDDIRRGRELREQHGNQDEQQEGSNHPRDNDGIDRT
jgi:membrane protein